jgi:hypothetical protein
MGDLPGVLCIVVVALGFITLAGHGLWVLAAALLRALFGRPPLEPDKADLERIELQELAATRRQLERLVDAGVLEKDIYDQLRACIAQRGRQLVGGEPRAAEPLRRPARPPVEPAAEQLPHWPEPLPDEDQGAAAAPSPAPAEAILEVLPADVPMVESPRPEVESEPSVVLPPRRSLGQVLAAFMEERNILWGELAGGLLIVGCSAALVVYLWQTQQQIPYFPFLVVAGVTAALFGAGLYTLHRWKLETTSRGLLVIATLLVPLSFLVMAGLSRGREGGWVEAGIEIAALGLFAWLVSLAGRVLADSPALPGEIDGRWLLTVAVLAASGVQLLVPRFVDAGQPALGPFLVLGFLPVACHGLAQGAVLWRAPAKEPLRERQAHALFAFLGMITFALAVALAFLIYWCEDPGLALQRAAALISLAGVPVLATGLLVHSSPVPDPIPDVVGPAGTGSGTDGLSGPVRTAGTAVALGGVLILLSAVVMAWPQPLAVLGVCTLDFIVLTVVAWRYRWPFAHAAALPCLAIAYLIAFHLLMGSLTVQGENQGGWMFELAISSASGAALTALALLLAAGAETLVRLGRQVDGIYHAAGAGIAAVICLALVARDGVDAPARAAVVYALCGLGGLAANARWRQAWLTYVGAAVCLGALAYALHWANPALGAVWLWLLTLLAHATLATAAGWRLGTVFGVPLRRCALASSLLALVPLALVVERDWMAPLSACVFWLAVIWLALSWVERWLWLFAAFQAMLSAAVVAMVTVWLNGQGWVHNYPGDLVADPRSLEAYGIGLGLLGLLWASARLALRRNEQVRYFLEPPWEGVDRWVLVCLVLGLLLLALYDVAPGVVAELTPADTTPPIAAWSAEAHGPGAWALLGTLALVLTTVLWDRRQGGAALLMLLLVFLAVPLLLAGSFTAERATASALRWGLALGFVVGSTAVWLRGSLTALAEQLGIHPELHIRLDTASRLVLLGGAAVPVLVLTAVAAGIRIGGEHLGGPDAGSVFGRMGSLASNLVPLVLVSFGLVGHALRERSAGYAFTAGLVANATLMGGYALAVVTAGGSMDDPEWVRIVQLSSLAAGVWAAIWLASRRWVAAWQETSENPSAQPLMLVQIAIGALGMALLVVPALLRIYGRPEWPLGGTWIAVGDLHGWLALLVTAAAAFWYAGQFGAHRREPVVIPSILAGGVLAACAAGQWDTGNWLAYHVLTATWAGASLALLTAGVVAASFRLSGLATVPSPSSPRQSTAAWFAELLPAEPTRHWLHAICCLLVLLALRGWIDPGKLYWSTGAVLAVCAIAGAMAVWFRHEGYVYVSGLLINLVGILIWSERGPASFSGFLAVNVLCLGLTSTCWSAIELTLRRAAPVFEPRGGPFPFTHAAAVMAMALLGTVVVLITASDWPELAGPRAELLSWLALTATAAACTLLLWDARAPLPLAGLYALGVMALGLALHGMSLSPERFGWAAALALAGYLVLTSAVARAWNYLAEAAGTIGIPDRAVGWHGEWFLPTQASVASVVVVLSLWMVIGFEGRSDRLAGPLALALLLPAGVLLSGAAGRWQDSTRFTVLGVGTAVLAELGWALLDPTSPAPWLHRSALLLVALAVATAFCGLVIPRFLLRFPDWVRCGRQAGPVLAILASAQLLIVLGHEAALYDPVARHTPLAWWGVLAVAAGLVLLIVAGLRFAVTPGREPLGLSERGRTLYVYAAELLVVLLLTHVRLNLPHLIPPFVGRYWPLVIMGIAFLGVGVAEWFERRGWRVLAEPLRRTGVFLPLLPLLAFWVRDLTELREAAGRNVPALQPLLRYLDRLEGGYALHAVVWFVLGMLYSVVAVSRRSFRFALLAALAANFGLWVIFANVQNLRFVAHPQLWLIPLALILLIAEHLNRDRLTPAQGTALRYLALTVLYLSSTADMFLAKIDNLVMPIVLAVLSLLGVLAGILLRVRAFLFQGLTFLFVVVFTMIWRAAVDYRHTWVWYVSGIVLGAAILALFALFEKRRNDVERVVQQLKKWE